MLSQEAVRLLSGIAVCVVLFSTGLWLFSRGVLRARYLIYVYLPVSLVLTILVLAMQSPLLPSWSARLLFSFAGAALIMIPGLIILWIRRADIDEWDQRRNK